MSGRVYVYSVPGDQRNMLIRCSTWTAFRDFLIVEKVPAMWLRGMRGWSVRSERIPDLIALAEHNGYTVVLKGALQ